MVVNYTPARQEKKTSQRHSYPSKFNLVSSRRNSHAHPDGPPACSSFTISAQDASVLPVSLTARRKIPTKAEEESVTINEGMYSTKPLLYSINYSETDYKDKMDIEKALELPLTLNSKPGIHTGSKQSLLHESGRISGLRTGNHSPSSRTQGNAFSNYWTPTQTRAQTNAHSHVDDARGRVMKLSREQSINISQYENFTRSNTQLNFENARQSSFVGYKSFSTHTINEIPLPTRGLDKNRSFLISKPARQPFGESTSSDTITRYRPEQTTVSLEVQLPVETSRRTDTIVIPSMQTENSYSKKLSSLAWRYQPSKRRCPLWSKPAATFLTNSPKEWTHEKSWWDTSSGSNDYGTRKRMLKCNEIHVEQSDTSFWSVWNILSSPSILASPVFIICFVCISTSQISNLDISPDFENDYYCIYLLALSTVLTIYRLYLVQLSWASAVRSCGRWVEVFRECFKLLANNIHCGNHVQAMVAVLLAYAHLCRKQLRMDTTISERQILQWITNDYEYFESAEELKQDLEDALAASGFLGSRLMMMQERILQRLSKRKLATKAEMVSHVLQKTQRCFGESLTIRNLISSQDAQIATLVRFTFIVACAVVILNALSNPKKVLVTSAMFVVLFILLVLDRLSTWVANPFETSGLKSSSLPLEYYCEVIGYEAENLINDCLRVLRKQADQVGVVGTPHRSIAKRSTRSKQKGY